MYAAHMTGIEELIRLRTEASTLRHTIARTIRSLINYKKKSGKLEQENHTLHQEIDVLKKREAELLHQLEQVKRQRDTYKGMVFKESKKQSPQSIGTNTHPVASRHRGGQHGHHGTSRTIPPHIDHCFRAYFRYCPECLQPLSRSSSCTTHTVTDIPVWKIFHPITTRYRSERQWCRHCHQTVSAIPPTVIAGSRLGINCMTMVLFLKYRLRLPLNKIKEYMATCYQLTISTGGIVSLLSKAHEWLGDDYDQILTTIRGSPVLHGDETGWRVAGVNYWAWTATTPTHTYYTIEESRGKGVAQKLFTNSIGVLVRDDYAAYTKLALPQQSCWAHLLRKSHEEIIRDGASDEVTKLHAQLKELFNLLQYDLSQPYDQKIRHQLYQWYTIDLDRIIATNYTHDDAKRIQTRIKHQYTNLLTALRYEGVPLTNNLAERAIRPLVVTRKISGGSQTPRGATIHAVNMSIIETIVKQHKPLLSTLQDYLLKGAAGKR